MRKIMLGLSAAVLLAGCDYVSMNVTTGNGSAAAPAAPGGNAMGPGGGVAGPATAPGQGFGPPGGGAPGGGAPGGTGSGPADPRAAAEIRACVETASRGPVPQGFDVQRYCTCAVSRALSGTAEDQAIQQCAAEQGLRQQ